MIRMTAQEAGQLTYQDVADRFQADLNHGLATREVVQRRKIYGYNIKVMTISKCVISF